MNTITNNEFTNPIEKKNNLIGLVLCGGKSARMQTDKAFIQYHHLPQAFYLYEQINTICEQVFLSCNQTQVERIDAQYPIIVDDTKYENNGPICAILSALEIHKNKSFLVLACDYPLLTFDDILKLKTVWENGDSSVSFYNNETNFREPLLAIYHQNDLEKLVQFYNKGNTSLQYFLNEINAKKINAKSNKSLTSIDTKEAFEKTYNLLNNL
ncbi:MAG: molybdenum cofactor guanylyltransferase [Bacteroidia bacterium]